MKGKYLLKKACNTSHPTGRFLRAISQEKSIYISLLSSKADQ